VNGSTTKLGASYFLLQAFSPFGKLKTWFFFIALLHHCCLRNSPITNSCRSALQKLLPAREFLPAFSAMVFIFFV
jgi:hypothetical protein